MNIYPRRLGRRMGQEIERVNVTREIVGTQIDNDRGWGSVIVSRCSDEDAPESAGREVAFQRHESFDSRIGPSPRDCVRGPSLKPCVGIHPGTDCIGRVALARYEGRNRQDA